MCLIIAGFLAMILLNAVLLHMQYRNYREKLAIVFDMEQIMEDYGFHESYQNIYQKRLYEDWRKTILLSLISFLLYLFAILVLPARYQRRYQKDLDVLDSRILSLRDGVFEMPEGDGVWTDEAESRLSMNFLSLSDYIRMIRQQSACEKEETKSLVTDISHQLKTPVAALKTSFEILDSNDLNKEEQVEFKKRCKDQLVRLEELVGALVNISKMEKGMIEIHSQEACIYETILKAVNRIYPEAEKNRIEISFEAEEELQRFCIPHDTKWMSEALINILENAVKYSPCEKSIIIRMKKMSMFCALRLKMKESALKGRKEMTFLSVFSGEAAVQ